MTHGLVSLIRAWTLWCLTFGKALGEPPGPLVDCVHKHAQPFKATDLRDKVYAVLSLSSGVLGPEKPAALYPDYEKVVIDVYIDIVRNILQNPHSRRNGKLGFLSLRYTPNTSAPSTNVWLPS